MIETQIRIQIVFWDVRCVEPHAYCRVHVHQTAPNTCFWISVSIASLKKFRRVLTRSTVSFFISSKERSEAMMDQESKEEREKESTISLNLSPLYFSCSSLSMSSNSLSLSLLRPPQWTSRAELFKWRQGCYLETPPYPLIISLIIITKITNWSTGTCDNPFCATAIDQWRVGSAFSCALFGLEALQ